MTEYRAHFSLWAMMAAPLMAGNDLGAMSDDTRKILTNPDVIAVDQDSAGIQGTLVQEGPPAVQVWSRPLKDGSYAVVLLNRAEVPTEITAYWSRVGLPRGTTANVRDLWAHKDLGPQAGKYAATVPAHGAVMLRVKPA